MARVLNRKHDERDLRVLTLRDQGVPFKQVAKEVGVHIVTAQLIYKHVNEAYRLSLKEESRCSDLS